MVGFSRVNPRIKFTPTISTNSESSSLIKRKRSKLNKHPNLYIENSKLLYNKCSKYIKEEI